LHRSCCPISKARSATIVYGSSSSLAVRRGSALSGATRP
jgi:hypothetical protein